MFSRRDVITGGAAFTQLRPAPAAAAAQQQGASNGPELNAIRDVLERLRHPPSWSFANQVRERQRTYLRQNQRYPEFIDIGVRVWEGLQDWHVENRQELKIGRAPEGRYMMEFMLTQLVLRTEIPDGEVSIGYDRQ